MKTFDPNNITFPVYVQPKMNGVYAELHTDGLFRSKTGLYFPAIQETQTWLKPARKLFGELYVHGWPLQKILGAVSPDHPNEDSKDVCFNVFDVEDHMPFHQRFPAWAKSYGFEYAHIKPVPVASSRTLTEIQTYHLLHIAMRYEGSVIRDMFGNVFKWKPFFDEEFICEGVIEGKGKRAGHVGKFVLRLNPTTTFHCGGGQVPYSELKRLFLHPPIGQKLTIRYNSKSVKGIPLCPQFICIRDYE